MGLFPWKSKYSVHVAEIDGQHKKLVALVNELFDAMCAGKGREVIGKAVDELTRYTQTHFATEERLMLSTGYPDYRIHKKEHDDFVAHVSQFQAELVAGKIAVTVEVSNYLKDWLINHILNSDMKYSTYFNEKGIY